MDADDRDDEAAEHRAAGPEAHGRGTADLRGEVADQGWGGHQADALDHADDETLNGEGPTCSSRPGRMKVTKIA